MNSPLLTPEDLIMVDVQGSDRWSIYHRLQDLGISCQCGTNQPLKVPISHPLGAIQLWSVVQQTTATPSDLRQWLNHCWQLKFENDYQ